MAEKNKIGLDDVLEGLSDVLGIVGSAAARRVTTPVKAAVEVAKTLPKAQKANEAIAQAKALEKKLDVILDKPKITKADAKKANDLADKINDKLGEAADLGASTKKNSTISKVDNAVSAKIADINKEAGVKAKPATKVPGPDEARAAAAKAETKTPAPATTKTKAPEPAVTKPATKATKAEEAPVTTKPTTKIEEGAELPGTKAKAPETPPKKETTEEKLARLKKEREEKAAAQKAERDKISAARKAEVDAARAARAAGAGSAGAAGTGEGENGDGGTGDNTVDPNDIPGGNGNNGDGTGDGDKGTGDGDKGTGDGDKGDGDKGNGNKGDGGDGDKGDGDNGEGDDDNNDEEPKDEPPAVDAFDLRWQILKAKLLAAGLPETTVNNSRSYFETILKDARFAGQPNELDAVVDQYLYLPTYQSKDGRTIDSPFYQDFGKFNEKLTARKKPGELVGLVLGYKRTIDKYVTSASAREMFKSDDSITKYMQNDVSVAELDERANAARLRSVTADPYYVQSLKELGYISDASDLTSFFLDPSVGTKALEDRRTAGAFATEAVRRASEATGIKLDTEFARQQAARLTNLGYSEAQITQLAGQGFENIAEQLRPTEKLSGIYERNLTGGAADAQKVQQELQAEQFLGTASQRRKKLAEQETQAFRGQSGLSTTALRSGTIGIL